ncbi:related to aldehyde dehydrogenase [Fusarium fujikuroi]|nr:related to aldehyde dehydrogenase [Fusarium fujikuroi]SCO26465.1 related to aldehyde dehydrogenase [Fusarium fujikuroi]
MQAFPNWTQTPVLERSRVLLRLAPILRQSSDEMAIMETRDTVKALSKTSTVDIAGGADRSLNAAMAAGNTMVYKPSEYTPAHGTVLAAIMTEAGCHPVSSPGQVSTGKKFARSAVQGMKYVTMELGGKSSLIVPPNDDIEDALSDAMMENYFASGQICTNGT